MEFQSRLDIFEPGDLTALVCIDVPEVQRIVVDQLTALNYKIHTGLFLEDILLKLRAHAYDVVVISEHFNGERHHARTRSSPRRSMRLPRSAASNSSSRSAPSLVTNDEMQAFQYSVDLVVGIADVVNLRPVLRRGVARMQEFYAPFREALKAEGCRLGIVRQRA